MKSHEISEVSKKDSRDIESKDWEEADEVVNHFFDKGFNVVGKGAYAVVLKKGSSNKIIKISTKEDQCWIKYVNWIKKQQNNPHVPKVFMLRQYTDNQGDKRFIAVLEALKPLPNSDGKTFRLLGRSTDLQKIAETFWIEVVGDFGMNVDVAVGYLEEVIEAAEFLDHRLIPIQRLPEFESMNNEDIATEILFKYGKSKFIQTLHRILEKLDSNRCFEDIHEGNVMIRPGTNELVITDPVGTSPGYSSPWRS